MNIGSTATQWYNEQYGVKPTYFRSSKYYLGYESWSKTLCWWFQLPLQFLEEKLEPHVTLVGEIASHQNKYFVLKIPINYFLKHLKKFTFLADKHINLMLSAEQHNFLQDIRGSGHVGFAQFLVESK